jgi:hypothetical protein
MGKQHTPAVIVEGAHDPTTPKLRIQQWCTDCNRLITERTVDVSEISLNAAGDIGGIWGTADGMAWLNHIGQRAANA